MKKLLFGCIFLVACSSQPTNSPNQPISTLTCSDNPPMCLSSPFCVGKVEGTACGSAGGMCTDIGRNDDPLLQPCCSCNNTVRKEPTFIETI